jgi:uncharacterized delta-60 repeat protein
VTIKYNPDGQRLWLRRYDGPASQMDVSTKIAVDGGGNVYVTGYSYGVGTWVDYATLKYDPNGNLLWVRRYDAGYAKEDWPFDIAVDLAGSAYVTGRSAGVTGYYDFATIKYLSDGTVAWVRRFEGPHSNDVAHALAVDSSGNVYVTGYGRNVGFTQFDFLTVKYDAAGALKWFRWYDRHGTGGDWAFDIAVDESEGVYVTGVSQSPAGDDDYQTIKYDLDGSLLWARTYDGPDAKADWAILLALDPLGNVIVSGFSELKDLSFDFATLKYSPSGNLAWVRRWDGPGQYLDQASGLAVDSLGRSYVTGRSFSAQGKDDFATVAYDAAGVELWSAIFAGASGYTDRPYAVAVDSQGDVYVGGSTIAKPATSYDYALVKYSPSPAVAIYCTTQVNSAGCAPAISSSGTPSASAGSGFTIRAADVLPNQFGIFFYGKLGPAATPFQGGTLCAHPPFVRTPVQNSGGSPPCGGSFSIDFNIFVASGADPDLVPGQTIWGQWWSRDGGFPPPANTNLTDAIEATLCP